MIHCANEEFWKLYFALPETIRQQADKNFELLKKDPTHPSLHFKKIGRLYSARVGLAYRALTVKVGDNFLWFWIGSHSDYDKLI